jgi:hypothetical protein
MSEVLMKNFILLFVTLNSVAAFASCPNMKAKSEMGTPWSYGLASKSAIDLGGGRTKIVSPYVAGDFKGTSFVGYERRPEDNFAMIGENYTGNTVCRCLGYDAYEADSKRIEDPGFVWVVRPIKSIILNGANSISELVCIKH